MSIKKKRVYEPRRLTLKGWAAIDDLGRSIDNAVKEGNWSAIPDLIIQIVLLTVEVPNVNKMFWMDIAGLYGKALEVNHPTKKFPILTSKEKGKPLPWEYEGRSWYYWLNLFAMNYGWNDEQVGVLDIDSAIGLYQEITIDQQLTNEWEWGLSEVSYVYNKSTKKSHYQPLPRPDWMRRIVGKPQPVKTYKMPVAMMPAGVVINLDETPPTKNTSE